VTWTHDHVLKRISRGLKAVVLSTRRLGPTIYGSPWPATFRELPPLAELEQWLELRREFEAAMHARNERPSAAEIALADEALAWPARYLADQPLQRDAVWLTARTIAFNLKLEKLLRERRIAADLMVEARKEFAPDIVRIYEDDAQDAAAKVAAWANAAFAKVSSRSKVIRIKQGARIRFKREIRKVKAIERITHVKRGDVMPGKLFNQSRVHHHRIAGVEAIIAGLERDGVKVR
jgi:hypothetical protein